MVVVILFGVTGAGNGASILEAKVSNVTLLSLICPTIFLICNSLGDVVVAFTDSSLTGAEFAAAFFAAAAMIFASTGEFFNGPVSASTNGDCISGDTSSTDASEIPIARRCNSA